MHFHPQAHIHPHLHNLSLCASVSLLISINGSLVGERCQNDPHSEGLFCTQQVVCYILILDVLHLRFLELLNKIRSVDLFSRQNRLNITSGAGPVVMVGKGMFSGVRSDVIYTNETQCLCSLFTILCFHFLFQILLCVKKTACLLSLSCCFTEAITDGQLSPGGSEA